MRNQKFRKLDVWIKSMEFISLVYQLTAEFPADERFGLTSQLRRAAISIALNIAEGSGSGTDAEFKRFLRMSLRSTYEVITALEISSNLNLANQDIINLRIQEADDLAAMISGLIKYLK
jgi:four helix bundle protein